MSHRNFSSFDEGETNDNPEWRKKAYKIKHANSSANRVRNKKNFKIYSDDEDSDRNYNDKRKNNNDYFQPQGFTKKSNRRYQQKSRNHDSDDDNYYSFRNKRDDIYTNEKQVKAKRSFGRKKQVGSDNLKKQRLGRSKTNFNTEVFPKGSKSFDPQSNINRNFEYEKTPENDYFKSKISSRKFNRNYKRDSSNETREANFHDSDFENDYTEREDHIKSPNVERLNRRSEYKSSNRYSTTPKKKQKSKMSRPTYDEYNREVTYRKNVETFKREPNYDSNDLDYNMDKVEGNEKDEFRSEEENNKHLGFSDISDESSVSDKEDEFSESDSDKESSGEPTAKEKLVNIIARSVWDPDPGDPAKDKELQQPFNHINYVDTDTPMCDNQEDCMDVMRHLKERDKTIKYNFYIGGDNLIYEGKGWVADVNEATGYRKRCLDVAFIGVFSVIRPSPPMLINAFHLVELGISTDKVLKGFTNDFRMCNRLD